MANLKKVVKLTEAQYETLAAGGTVGEYTGLSENYMYLVQDTSTTLAAYPIGSIYMSMNSTNPHNLFGGEWDQICGRFLVGQIPDNADMDEMNDLGYAQHTSGHYVIGTHTSAEQYMNESDDTNLKGEVKHTLTIAELPSHNHGLQNTSGTRFGYGNNYNNTSASTTSTMLVSGNTNLNTTSTGSGTAHNNMPPFAIVYMWKRVA